MFTKQDHLKVSATRYFHLHFVTDIFTEVIKEIQEGNMTVANS